MKLDAEQAFSIFARRALIAGRAERFSALARSVKGKRKLLTSLDHDFERAIRIDAKKCAVDRRVSCYAFHRSVGFGAEFSSIGAAYSRLSNVDGWLIVVSDGSAGIYRPESRWDETVEIAV